MSWPVARSTTPILSAMVSYLRCLRSERIEADVPSALHGATRRSQPTTGFMYQKVRPRLQRSQPAPRRLGHGPAILDLYRLRNRAARGVPVPGRWNGRATRWHVRASVNRVSAQALTFAHYAIESDRLSCSGPAFTRTRHGDWERAGYRGASLISTSTLRAPGLRA